MADMEDMKVRFSEKLKKALIEKKGLSTTVAEDFIAQSSFEEIIKVIGTDNEHLKALEKTGDMEFALSSPAFISTFVLEENFDDVLAEYDQDFQLEDPDSLSAISIQRLNTDFDFASMISDDRYHLSPSDKELALKNLKSIRDKYATVGLSLWRRISKEVVTGGYAGGPDLERVIRDDAEQGDKDIYYKIVEIVENLDHIIRPISPRQIGEAKKSMANGNPKDMLSALNRYGMTVIGQYLSDDEIAQIVTLQEEREKTLRDRIDAGEQEKKDLNRRAGLLERYHNNEGTLRGLEDKLQVLEAELAELRAHKEVVK